jgi:hypothetical protein
VHDDGFAQSASAGAKSLPAAIGSRSKGTDPMKLDSSERVLLGQCSVELDPLFLGGNTQRLPRMTPYAFVLKTKLTEGVSAVMARLRNLGRGSTMRLMAGRAYGCTCAEIGLNSQSKELWNGPTHVGFRQGRMLFLSSIKPFLRGGERCSRCCDR